MAPTITATSSKLIKDRDLSLFVSLCHLFHPTFQEKDITTCKLLFSGFFKKQRKKVLTEMKITVFQLRFHIKTINLFWERIVLSPTPLSSSKHV